MKSLTVKVEKKLKEYTPKIVVEKIPKIKNCPKCQNEAIALFKIKLDNAEPRLRWGMTVNVTFKN